MNRELRFLMIEDVAPDVVLTHQEFTGGANAFRCRRIDSEQEFLYQIHHFPPDVILCDQGLPGIDGVRRKLEMPFLMTAPENTVPAVHSFEAGESVFQSRLRLLAPVLRRALVEAEWRARRRHKELELEAALDEVGRTLAHAENLAKILSVCFSHPEGDVQECAAQLRQFEHLAMLPPPDSCGECRADGMDTRHT